MSALSLDFRNVKDATGKVGSYGVELSFQAEKEERTIAHLGSIVKSEIDSAAGPVECWGFMPTHATCGIKGFVKMQAGDVKRLIVALVAECILNGSEANDDYESDVLKRDLTGTDLEDVTEPRANASA